MKRRVVCTDLDGTLLDARTYEWTASVPGLRQLRAADAALVFCSSKTRLELEYYQAALGVTGPMIVENGSAIARRGYGRADIVFGRSAAEIRSALARVRERTGLDFEGYGDLSRAAVASVANLDAAGAARAMAREFSETIVTPLSATDLRLLAAACAEEGLAVSRGSRFHTVVAAGVDKGTALRCLLEGLPGTPNTAGIGDSPNDSELLAAVQYAYLVRRPDESWAAVDLPCLRRVAAVGPAGFSLAVADFLARC